MRGTKKWLQAIALFLASLPHAMHAQPAGWLPSKPVELIVGVSAGGGIDRTARIIQKVKWCSLT